MRRLGSSLWAIFVLFYLVTSATVVFGDAMADQGDPSPAMRLFAAYLLLDVFLALASVLNVLGKPRSTFAAVDRHKYRWLLGFVLAALVYLAPPLWLYWVLRVRPTLPGERRMYENPLAGRTARGVAGRSSTPSSESTSYDPWEDERKRKCATCNGSGKVRCTYCTGGYQYGNPCLHCDVGNRMPCTSCGGRGHR